MIREAIVGARLYDEFLHYGRLKPYVQIVDRKTYVTIRWLDIEALPEEKSSLEVKDAFEVKKAVPEAESLFDIIGHMLHLEPGVQEASFPNVVVSDEEMEQVHAWAVEAEWKLIDHEGAGVTLTRLDVPDELLWKPEEVDDGLENETTQ